jgi:hypothetical protein
MSKIIKDALDCTPKSGQEVILSFYLKTDKAACPSRPESLNLSDALLSHSILRIKEGIA